MTIIAIEKEDEYRLPRVIAGQLRGLYAIWFREIKRARRISGMNKFRFNASIGQRRDHLIEGSHLLLRIAAVDAIRRCEMRS